jgi:predicted transposase/invertase (TIGR01784 family)
VGASRSLLDPDGSETLPLQFFLANLKCSQFTSQEVKQLAFRLDGLFLPIIEDSQLPFYIVEVQFQPDPNLYYRLFAELFIYLKQYQPRHPWQLVVIYPNRQTERENNLHFQQMLALPNITRIYLDELSPVETASLPIKLLRLIIEPENTASELARELARQAEIEIANTAVKKSSRIVGWVEARNPT